MQTLQHHFTTTVATSIRTNNRANSKKMKNKKNTCTTPLMTAGQQTHKTNAKTVDKLTIMAHETNKSNFE